ncbi:MAG: helix-turn-helix domain-containing protein [Treponema sp.]|nr:helix-turn-helix domain-containing protein [Treponema sp.]
MSDLYERIDYELDKRGWFRADLCRETGISEGTVRGWKRGSAPSAEALYKVSQAFGISLEYLLTGENHQKEKAALTPEEEKLLESFRSLSDKEKNAVMSLVKSLQGKIYPVL